jgi:putative transposase
VRFIAEHKDHRVGPDGLRWGVESICAVLTEHGCAVAPSTYYEAVGRAPSRRALRDEDLKVEIARVHEANYGVYGPRKVWLALNREGIEVARCTIERLMRDMGLAGARRGKKVITTRPDPTASRAADLVKRRFLPLAPNRLWVADFTYVSTWSGTVYVAFVIDAYARRILGWRAATNMTTDLVLDTIEQAIWTRAREGITDLDGLVHHNDAGSQGGFNWPSQHLDQEAARWATDRSRSRHGYIEGRFLHRDGRRLRGARTGSGSGRRSHVAPRPRRRVSKHACQVRLGSAGSATLAA